MKKLTQESMTREIAVVNFAGGGGSDDGIERYTDLMVGAAINHDAAAIAMHRLNHPYTEHYQEDVFQVDPVEVCRGRPVGLAWFSPDCTHFSRAKGGTPVKKEIRGLSWVIVRWAMTVRPRVIAMENVVEIRSWGPLVQDARGEWYPDPARKGETFQGFVAIMTTGIEPGHPALLECCMFLGLDPAGNEAGKLARGLGYDMEWRELCAADFGVPTIRERFFGVFRCDGAAIRWPEQTHGKRDSAAVKAGRLKPWLGAHTVIDWGLPAPSIFAGKTEIKKIYGINAVRPLAENTMRRIARGLEKFVLNAGRPFIVPIGYGERQGQQSRVQSMDEPMSTIVSSAKQYVCEPVMSSIVEVPILPYTSEQVNTVCAGGGCGQTLVTPYLAQYHQEQGEHVRGQTVAEPIMTVDGANRYGVAAPVLVKYYGGDEYGQAADAPLHTVTARDREGISLAHICKFKGQDLGQHPGTPLHTVTASWGEFAAIESRIARYAPGMDLGHWPEMRNMLNTWCGYELAADEVLLRWIDGAWWFIRDIGLRMLTAREAFNAMGFAPDYIIDFQWNGRPYPKSEQMKKAGNAVCPPLAGLIAAANLPEYARKKPCDSQRDWAETVAV